MLHICIYGLIITLLIFWIELPSNLSTNLLIIRKNPAEELENWLKKFNWGSRSELQRDVVLPHYKFYTDIVEVLLGLARRVGGHYQESLLFLREGLQSDRQFEKKLREMIFGAWLQMGLMVILTWGFIFGAMSLVEIKISVIKLIFIFSWQVVGLGLLPILLKIYRAKYFGDIGKLWRIFYILRSLSKAPLPRSEVMRMAHIQELKEITQDSLAVIVEKLKDTCQRALQIGVSYEEDVKYLMEELRFQEKWHFELFEKKLLVIKLALLSVFFLPAYIAFIFVLLGDLLALM